MTYSSYRMSNGTTMVTIKNTNTIEMDAADRHLLLRGSNSGDFGKRYIFSDKGDHERFLAFEKAVKDAYAA